MWNDNLLYILFLVQVLFISFYFPNRLVKQIRLVIELHPPKDYPKLYPVSVDALTKWITKYLLINYLILIVGFYIIGYGAFTKAETMLGLNNIAVVFFYFMLQYTPMLVLEFSSFKFQRKMRALNTQTKRVADLSPRKFSDYIDAKWVLVTIVSHLILIGIVIYFIFNPFEGFGGATNLVVLFLTDLFFISLIAWQIYGRKKNPYQAKEDRAIMIRNMAKGMFITINLVIAFVAFSLLNKAFGYPSLKESGMVFYFIVLAIISLRTMIVDVKKINFDVYKSSNEEVSH